MPVNRWYLSIDLDDLWNDPENLPMDRREEIAARLRASNWPRFTSDRRRLEWLIGNLENATPDEAEVWWTGLYNMADADRVWLDLDGVEKRRRERIDREMKYFVRVRVLQHHVHAAEPVEDDPFIDLRSACGQTGLSTSNLLEVLDDFDAEVTCSSCRKVLKQGAPVATG